MTLTWTNRFGLLRLLKWGWAVWYYRAPEGDVASPRFGIRQGAKVRPIDNLSVSGINSTVGLPEKLKVNTIDEVAAMIKRCMQEQEHKGSCSLVSRTYDLKKAFCQLGVSEAHHKVFWIAVWSIEHNCVKLFRMKGLPFDALVESHGVMWDSFFFVCFLFGRPLLYCVVGASFLCGR